MTNQRSEIDAIAEAVLSDQKRCDKVATVATQRMRDIGIPAHRVFISTRFQHSIVADIFFIDADALERHAADAHTHGSAIIGEEMLREFEDRGRKSVSVQLKDFQDIVANYGGSYAFYHWSN